MTSIFASYLKARFERFLSDVPNSKGREQSGSEESRIRSREDFDRSLREHELYYWSSAPGPWY